LTYNYVAYLRPLGTKYLYRACFTAADNQVRVVRHAIRRYKKGMGGGREIKDLH